MPNWKGVGEAGAKGLGRLSREMEQANTRLAAFARRAGLALGAAAAAATASLGLIVRSTAETPRRSGSSRGSSIDARSPAALVGRGADGSGSSRRSWPTF